MKIILTFIFALIFTLSLSAQEDLTKYVNPFIGTGGEGHCYPGATVPFGMVQPSPDTHLPDFNKSAFPWCAGYQYGDSSIIGFSQTHFSGTGHSDMGDILIMPTTGALNLDAGTRENPDEGYRSLISKNEEWAEPGYYGVMLKKYNIKAEMTATERVAFYKFTFPTADNGRLILDLTSSIYNYDGKVIWSEVRVIDDYTISGYRQTKGWAADRKVFFIMKFSEPVVSYGLVDDEDFTYKGFGNRDKWVVNYPYKFGRKLKAYFNFSTLTNNELKLKISISATSTEGALNNLLECPSWDFGKVRIEANELWQKELNKYLIEAPEKEKQIFYTSVYHSLLSPVIYMDYDHKYRGIDGNIYQDENFTNYTIFSLWDTYRALHPLFTITQQERVRDIVLSMLHHQYQSPFKMLPVWSFHGNETWCMIGYHAVSVIADAYLKGLLVNIKSIDILGPVIKTANNKSYGGIPEYLKYGYVAQDIEKEGASKTLEYAYDDWSIAMMFKSIGNDDLYDEYIKRASNWKNVWDPVTKFMRAKNSDGSWNEPFDPLFAKYGGDYTEGNAWQYSWYVPQDVQGLIDLHGGDENFITKLDSLFIIKTDDEKYKGVEDIAGLIGQYAHGNEPSQHIAYLYNYAGAPWKTQEKIHLIMNNLFNNTPEGICGNEDCGQMSAWYIFSSLGFYPVCPGSLEYIIGTPKLNKAVINVGEDKIFTIKANNLSPTNYYIQSVKLNGKMWNKSFIRHEDIMNGGELVFEMGSEPNKYWASDKDARPYSMSR
jgi:predicted alpha-1,2-mannosidase